MGNELDPEKIICLKSRDCRCGVCDVKRHYDAPSLRYPEGMTGRERISL